MNIRIIALALAQSCYWFATLIAISLSGVIGSQLAPDSAWATVPYGLISIGALLSTYSLSQLMFKCGRRIGLRLGAWMGFGAGLLCVLAIVWQSFYLFCLANLLMGIYQASAAFYRLAAMDETTESGKGAAIGWVLSGSLLAAVLGPLLAQHANGWISGAEYAGSYLLASFFSLISVWLLGLLSVAKPMPIADKSTSGTLFLKQPAYWVGVGNTAFGQFVMMIMMVITPLAMHAQHHSAADGLSVIGWHIIGMFAPSLITGKLADRFGVGLIAIAGLLILGLSAGVAIMGMTLGYYYVSLFLLGVGWNFLYVAGTGQYSKAYLPAEQGKAQGIAEWAIALAAIIAVISSGLLLQVMGWQQANEVLIYVLIVVLGLNIWWIKIRKMS